MQIVQFILDQLNKVATLAEDRALLKRGEQDELEPISFELRMAVVYRAEKKKILQSQVNLIQKVILILNKAENILTNVADTNKDKTFADLILEETSTEALWRKQVEESHDMRDE